MPWKPKTPCRQPGCPELSDAAYCPAHRGDADRARGSAAKRGYGRKWRKRRARFLEGNPLCAECLDGGRVEASTDVDHIEPRDGADPRFWDEDNWQALCHPHHSRKTSTKDGGFRRG